MIVTGTVDDEPAEAPPPLTPAADVPLVELAGLCATELTAVILAATVWPDGSSTVTGLPTFASLWELALRSTVTISCVELVRRIAVASAPALCVSVDFDDALPLALDELEWLPADRAADLRAAVAAFSCSASAFSSSVSLESSSALSLPGGWLGKPCLLGNGGCEEVGHGAPAAVGVEPSPAIEHDPECAMAADPGPGVVPG